jgi:hypothetical protein
MEFFHLGSFLIINVPSYKFSLKHVSVIWFFQQIVRHFQRGTVITGIIPELLLKNISAMFVAYLLWRLFYRLTYSTL